jgi:exopolysaccharide production protein ExoQ
LRFIAVLRTSLVGVLLATYTPKEQAQLFTRVFMICGLLSLFAVVALPSYGIAYGGANGGSWRGVFVFKNALGMMMALGATLSSLRLIFTRQYFRITVLSLIGAVILIIFSQSATSLVAFVAATLLIPMQKIVKQYYKLRVVLYIFAILASLALAVLVINNLNLIVEDFLGKSLTLTGRDTLWKAIIDQGLQRPWSGYGYSAFWYSDASLDAVANNPTGWPALPPSGQYLTSFHSHNGYVELFVQLGYPGLILVGASCLTVLFRIIQFLSITKAIEGLWMLQIILMMLITNYTEVPTFMAANQLQWILYVSISFSTALQLERIKRGTKITKKEVKRAFLPQPTNITG